MSDKQAATLGPIGARMHQKLRDALAPSHLQIEDESERHRGHAGFREGGETHFRVSVTSSVFVGMSRVERARRVHEILAAELKERVHALSLTLSTE